jgi:hypothetical protein
MTTGSNDQNETDDGAGDNDCSSAIADGGYKDATEFTVCAPAPTIVCKYLKTSSIIAVSTNRSGGVRWLSMMIYETLSI